VVLIIALLLCYWQNGVHTHERNYIVAIRWKWRNKEICGPREWNSVMKE